MAVEKHSDDRLCSSDFYVVYVNVNTYFRSHLAFSDMFMC